MIIDFQSRTASVARDVSKDWEAAMSLSSEGLFVGFNPNGEPVITSVGDLKFTEAAFLLAWGQNYILEASNE